MGLASAVVNWYKYGQLSGRGISPAHDFMNAEIERVKKLLGAAEKARQQKQFKEAKRDLISALAISRLIQHVDLRSQALNDLAGIERDLGNIIPAIAGYMKLVKLCQKHNNKCSMADAYRHMAEIYLEADHLKKADSYYKKAIRIYSRIAPKNSLDLANTTRELALLKIKQKKNQEALTFWEKTLELYQTNHVTERVKECERWIAKLR